MLRLGWGLRPVVNTLATHYPQAHIDDLKAIVQLATEACVAGSLYRDLPADQKPVPSDIPTLPE
jgi:hypothetical protein